MSKEEFFKIASKFDTDKIEHGYLEFYYEHLPPVINSILEIGCYKGESIRMWKKLFPSASIHCLDLFEEHAIPNDSSTKDIKFWKGNQIDFVMLNTLRRIPFDVIIDDGSHNSRDQLISFFGLATKGCHYFIEDLHCQEEEFYSQDLPIKLNAANLFKGSDFVVYGNKIALIKC